MLFFCFLKVFLVVQIQDFWNFFFNFCLKVFGVFQIQDFWKFCVFLFFGFLGGFSDPRLLEICFLLFFVKVFLVFQIQDFWEFCFCCFVFCFFFLVFLMFFYFSNPGLLEIVFFGFLDGFSNICTWEEIAAVWQAGALASSPSCSLENSFGNVLNVLL